MTDAVPQTPQDTLLWPGAPLRDMLLGQVKQVVSTLPFRPTLAIVQVGAHPASTVYVRRKLAAARDVGIDAYVEPIAADSGPGHLAHVVHGLCAAPDVHALIVQMPVPEPFDGWGIIDRIPPEKDCDGLSLENAHRREARDLRALLPATPLGIMRLLRYQGIALHGLRVAVLGRSRIVGGPLRAMLRAAGADVLEINRDTPHPQQLCRQAAVVISAVGVPHLLDEAWVRPGAMVIDVGITRHEGALLGDVNPARVMGVARALTPVPGGVGPLTVASLLTNVVDCACLQQGIERPEWRV